MLGGTYVIIQHASYLRNHGYDVTRFRNFRRRRFPGMTKRRSFVNLPIEAKQESFDLVIAMVENRFELGNFDARRYAYFVQSVESRFYPESEGPLRALVDAPTTSRSNM